MKPVLLLVTIALVICSCSGSPAVPATATTISMDDAVKTVSASTVLTLTASAPTNTPLPTKTPQPTKTPIPTATSTPAPEPIILTGSGDNVVDLNKWDGVAIIRATHNGQRNFIVHHFAGNKDLGSLFNVIGNYSGTKLLDEKNGELTTRIQVKADGQWQFQILPLAGNVRVEKVPGTITGTGDDVVVISGKNLDLLKSEYPGDSNFIIHVWTANGVKSLVNEIGPYSGTTILPNESILLEIIATGPWSLEITGK